MYNKKCINTYLFVMALICLITLILPFINVGFLGSPNVFIKILYYTSIVIFAVSIIVVIGIGIYSLFKNNFALLAFQELFAFVALFMLLIISLIFLPISGLGLTAGFSLLFFETFVMALFNTVLRLIKKLPLIIKGIKEKIRIKKENLAKIEEEKVRLEQENENKQVSISEEQTFQDESEEVEIIPPDEEMIYRY